MTGLELCDAVVSEIRAICEEGKTPISLRLASVIGCEARCRIDLKAGKALNISDYVTLQIWLESRA